MPMVSELDLPAIEYADPAFVATRYHAVLAELRATTWLARAEPFGYVALDHEAVGFFLRSRDTVFPGHEMLQLLGITDGPIYTMRTGNLLDLRGDSHRRLRRLVEPAFTPAAVNGFRPAMRAHLAELFAPALSANGCEVVHTVAKPYAARVIATLMGVGLEHVGRLADWAYWIQSAFDPLKVAGSRQQIEAATVSFFDFARELVEQRRIEPGTDLLSRLVTTEVDGDRLSDDEVVNLATAVLIGGVDTTQSQLAHGLRLFAEHPEQWALLVADRSLVGMAVAEILRFEPITPFTARMTTSDVVFRGVSFPAGTVVLTAAATANRDPAVYADPDVFDIRTARGPRPRTFGAGPHVCLGASLATAELQEALDFFAQRISHLALDGDPEYDTITGIYGLRSLFLRFSNGAVAASSRGHTTADGSST